MSADHTIIQLALRAKLATLSVATTGVTSLSATATGYNRAAGSFVADGFAVGMEVQPTGFASNTVGTIIGVTATDLAINGGRTAEGVAGARSLVVGLPSMRAYENIAIVPVTGRPYVEEQYIPGPSFIANDNYAGLLELRPMYSPRIYVPENTGVSADGRYADAVARLFLPGTTIVLSSGEQLIARGDVAYTRGQRSASATAGWSCVPITIPLKVTTVAIAA